MRQRLCKYFTQREWAEQFLDGSIYFNSLGYFCDYEDEEVRGDKYEGIHFTAQMQDCLSII
jgi:hypothetical protein